MTKQPFPLEIIYLVISDKFNATLNEFAQRLPFQHAILQQSQVY